MSQSGLRCEGNEYLGVRFYITYYLGLSGAETFQRMKPLMRVMTFFHQHQMFYRTQPESCSGLCHKQIGVGVECAAADIGDVLEFGQFLIGLVVNVDGSAVAAHPVLSVVIETPEFPYRRTSALSAALSP